MSRLAMKEFCLLFLGALVINFLWTPGDPGFTQARPHPYLIIILIMAVRHGALWALASVATLTLSLCILSANSVYSLSPLDFLSRPWNFILANWIVLGVLVGSATDSKHREQKKLHSKLQQLEGDLEDSLRRLRLTDAENIELRKKVFGEGETLTTVYEMARRLITLKGQDLFQASLDLVGKFVGASQSSVYLLDSKRQAFLLQETRGLGRFQPPTTVGRGDALLEKALQESRVVSVKDLFSAEKQRQLVDSVMVAPIGGEQGSECGVLVIHQLPMDRLNPQSVGVFRLLADWVSRSLNLVQRFEASENPHTEFLSQIQKRRFSTSFIRTLLSVSDLKDLALEVLGSEDYGEVAYWNASKMLRPSGDDSVASSEPKLRTALEVLLTNGSHLGAVLASLPVHPELPGCKGLRLRIQERAQTNAQATLRVLKVYITQHQSPAVLDLSALIEETEPSRRHYHLDNLTNQVKLLNQRKSEVAYCIGLDRPDGLKASTKDLLLSLCHDSDRWTRRLAALASYELRYEVDKDVQEALVHSDHRLDREVGLYLSEMEINS